MRNLLARLFNRKRKRWYQKFQSIMPDGTTSDILAQDIEQENFDIAHFELPNGYVIDLYRKADL